MARGEIIGSPKVRAHVKQCLRCQAEMSRERRIQRELRNLRHETPVPSALADRILKSVNSFDRSMEIKRRQSSRVAGACAMGAAVVLAVLSVPTRRRTVRTS